MHFSVGLALSLVCGTVGQCSQLDSKLLMQEVKYSGEKVMQCLTLLTSKTTNNILSEVPQEQYVVTAQ